MMRFASLDDNDLRYLLNSFTKIELIKIVDFIDELVSDSLSSQFEIVRKHSLKKSVLVNYLKTIFLDTNYIVLIYQKLYGDEVISFIYQNLIWEYDFIDTQEIVDKFNYKFNRVERSFYSSNVFELDDKLALVKRKVSHYYSSEEDKLFLDENMKSLLKLVSPIPKNYELETVEVLEDTQFSYSNEDSIFNFISTISDMLKNNLIEFGKSNEKPLAKTLNILKSSTGVKEFYSEKKLDSLVTDMLTRSFSYHYWESKNFKSMELETLKNLIQKQLDDEFEFFIVRTFATHLKKVRYDSFTTSQKELFDVVKLILSEIPKDDWVSCENILKFCKYRDMKFYFETKYKTDDYYMDGDAESYYVGNNYEVLFFEPILKASFFYLASLGLFELKYNTPISGYSVTAKGKDYISTWDSLKYIKLTNLGKYVFGFIDSYEQKVIEKKQTTIKFDEYKPIITIDSNDTITKVKLESFCDNYDDNRYILSYGKIFKDCKNSKALEVKIDSFYKQIESNPPQVFKDFFDEIKENQNLLKKDLKQVVIELKNSKKLLNLFMKNKKLQELIIKAQGFRIIVLKDDLAKVTKIVRDNGFFVEF